MPKRYAYNIPHVHNVDKARERMLEVVKKKAEKEKEEREGDHKICRKLTREERCEK